MVHTPYKALLRLQNPVMRGTKKKKKKKKKILGGADGQRFGRDTAYC